MNKNKPINKRKKSINRKKKIIKRFIFITTLISLIGGIGVSLKLINTITTDGSNVLAMEKEEEQSSVQTSFEKSKGKLIVIDAGHGGEDPGSTISTRAEKEVNLEVALKLETALKKEGYSVILTRSDDTFLSLDERAELANKINADLFISLHQNAFVNDSNVNGIEVYYNQSNKTKADKELAQAIQTNLIKNTNARDRGIRISNALVVTRKTTMPSCLIEMGYMTNSVEDQKLQTTTYQSKIVDGIVEGVNQFFN